MDIYPQPRYLQPTQVPVRPGGDYTIPLAIVPFTMGDFCFAST